MLAFIIILLLVVIFMVGFLGNLATERPEGCPVVSDCHSCSTVSCSHHPSKKEDM